MILLQIQDYQHEQEEDDFYEDKGTAYKHIPSRATENLTDLSYFTNRNKLTRIEPTSTDDDIKDEENKKDKLIKERNDALKKIETLIKILHS